MAFIPAPASCRIEVRFSQDGQQVENVYHCLITDPLDATQAGEIESVFHTWIAVTLRPHQTDNVIYRELVLTGLAAQSSPRATFPGDGLPGTLGSNAMPNATTLSVKANTLFGGRSARGRTYHIGLDRLVVVDNVVTPTEATALTTIYNALVTAMDTAGHPLHVLSYFANGAPRAAGVQFPIENYSLADVILDTQRRRGPGRGN